MDSELSDKLIDEHWNIDKKVIGANSVCVRPSKKDHINLYIHKEGFRYHVEIPHSSVNISDNSYGVVVSSK